MAANFLWLPDDVATCALIKILWGFHCGIHGYDEGGCPKVAMKPEWVRTPLQEKVREIGISFAK